MKENETITIISKRRKLKIFVKKILYIHMRRKHADICMDDGKVIDTRTTYKEFVKLLGDEFIEIRRGTMVSAIAIHNVTDMVNLNNGVRLEYTLSRKDEIEYNLYLHRKKTICLFSGEGIPATFEEYREYYRCFEKLQVAFTDIEMIFDEGCHAVDWVFRYGNQALAELEGIPLEKMIGKSFRCIFPNMDEKWLRNYERAVLFGDTIGMSEYSPEIDKNLNILCFPTFEGHCGCVLLDAGKINIFNDFSPKT